MHDEAKQNQTSMTALHLSDLAVSKWTKIMRAKQFTYIHGGITIANSKPGGYSASLLHQPLPSSQRFQVYRMTEATMPTNNFSKLFTADPRNQYRQAWASCVCIQPKDYNKKGPEARKCKVLGSWFLVVVAHALHCVMSTFSLIVTHHTLCDVYLFADCDASHTV
jgi:hypothetical protein